MPNTIIRVELNGQKFKAATLKHFPGMTDQMWSDYVADLKRHGAWLGMVTVDEQTGERVTPAIRG